MRKRKDSHDGSPVGDTNILFVPDSSADPSASGVDALMGMIGEAGAPPQAVHQIRGPGLKRPRNPIG